MKRLDARNLEPAVRDADIFRSFDALPPGEALELIHDCDSKPLLVRFIAERTWQFDWHVLQADPDLFRVQLSKRSSTERRGVTEYMQGDHVRLDEMLEQVVDKLEGGDAVAARAVFAEFACGIGRHMRAEEQVLFPAFERATGMTGGPVVVMCGEHDSLRQLLHRIVAELSANDAQTAHDDVRDLMELLGSHNVKEENVIYPRTDDQLDAQARDELVRQMQLI